MAKKNNRQGDGGGSLLSFTPAPEPRIRTRSLLSYPTPDKDEPGVPRRAHAADPVHRRDQFTASGDEEFEFEDDPMYPPYAPQGPGFQSPQPASYPQNTGFAPPAYQAPMAPPYSGPQAMWQSGSAPLNGHAQTYAAPVQAVPAWPAYSSHGQAAPSPPYAPSPVAPANPQANMHPASWQHPPQQHAAPPAYAPVQHAPLPDVQARGLEAMAETVREFREAVRELTEARTRRRYF